MKACMELVRLRAIQKRLKTTVTESSSQRRGIDARLHLYPMALIIMRLIPKDVQSKGYIGITLLTFYCVVGSHLACQ